MIEGGRQQAFAELPVYVSAGRAVAAGTALLLALVAWSAVIEVEVVVSAPAAARAVPGVAELRAPETRRVTGVKVREGQQVRGSETLITLESSVDDARFEAISRALAAARRTLHEDGAVLRLLEDGGDPSGAPTARARLRVLNYLSRLSELDAEVRAIRSELVSARAQSEAAARLLDIDRQRHEAARAAFGLGALSRFEWLRARQELLFQQSEAEALAGHVRVLEQRLAAQRRARRSTGLDVRQSLMASIDAAEVETADLESRLAEAAEQRRQARITAPVTGTVNRLLVAEGDFVQRGEPLGEIVPEDAAIVFETRIAPRQMAFLYSGQACRIKLDALPFARYGALSCTVELLGRDVVESDDGSEHYLARVRPAARSLVADGSPVQLQPGATGWVDIIAGRRTVLSFVTEPLQRFARESLRER